MQANPHLDPTRLTAYVLGKLSWPEMEQVEMHLASCASCRAEVGAREGEADSFLPRLRAAAVPPVDDPALNRLLNDFDALARSTAKAGSVKIVAGHEVVRELARGGLGIVYLARHPHLRDFRAIKRPLSPDGPDRDNLLARFRREVQAVGALDALRHDHIIRAIDAGADEEGPYLVTEYLDGKPLSRLLDRGGLSVAEACELIRQAALGLQAAHERGLVHRDVKPSNLMLARANSGARVVVIDWGLVKWGGESVLPRPLVDGPTGPGTPMGTPDYMAPEQVADARAVDIRADVYSLGCTLYCLLAEKPPFHGRRAIEKLLAHQREAFPPLDRMRSDIPAELHGVLRKMVEKQPAQRFATPGAVAEALRPFCCPESHLLALLEREDGVGGAGETVTVPPWRRIGWLLAGAASVLLVVGVLALMLRGKTTQRGRESEVVAVLGEGPATPVSMTGHPGHCSSLVFMPDGMQAVSESGGGGVYVWDLKNRLLKHSWLHMWEKAHDDLSGVVAVSPNGKLIAAAGLNSFPRHLLLLRLYDSTTYQPIGKNFTFARMSHAVAFSPDSSRLATVELPGILGLPSPRIRIIDIQTEKTKTFLIGSPINSIAFSPDGNFLLTGGDDKSLRLWRLDPHRQEREFPGHAGAVNQVAFSADGKRIFSASNADETLRVWNNDKDAVKAVKPISAAKMACTAFWPGGRALTGHADGSVVLWNLENGAELLRFPHPGARVTAVAISPDGCHALAALTDRLVYLYRLPAPRRQQR